MQNDYRFQPSKVADSVSKKLFIERLPEWMQNVEQIQKFSDDIIQQWFNPAEEDVIDGYIGDIGSPAAAGKIFLKEKNVQRQMYQLSPAYVSRNVDNSVNTVQFYDDLINYLRSYGSIVDNQDRLLSSKFYSWTPPINPNKLQNYGSYVWDNNNEFGIEPDYIVMERGSIDGNTWSLQNYWYTIGQKLPNGETLTEEMLNDVRFSRAQAPIIEFNKNIELMNHGSKFRGVVDYLSDSVKPEDIVQRTISDNIKVDGSIITAGDRILFTSIGNSGENNRIYKVYIDQMADGSRVYGLALDEDEINSEHPTGEPNLGDVVLVRSGIVYKNTSMYWNGTSWIRSQAKNGTNVFPQFQLYDRNSIKLNDPVIYPSSDFDGSKLFGFKVNFDYNLDKIYNEHVELNEYNYYIFENFLQSQRFTYNRLGARAEINGLYYYSRRTDNGFELVTDWVRSDELSKQFVKQVPEMTKISMYRIFNTIHDMNVFTSSMDGMDCYVIETDEYYKYIKNETTGVYSWIKMPTESIVTDTFNREFELAQKINSTNPSDIIQVQINGELSSEYTTVLDNNNNIQKIIVNSDVPVNENTVICIRTYSSSIVPDFNLGAYEIPMNMQYNPYNENILYVDQSNYTLHFYDIIGENITSGSVSGINDYENRLENGLVDNSVGTHIIQNEASLLPLMLYSANSNLDLFEAIIFNQNEYFRFKNKFNTTLVNMYNADPSFFSSTSASDIVDIILNKINVGKDGSFPFALDNVGSNATVSRAFIPCTPQFLGIMKAYVPQKATYLYAGRELVPYNIDHTGVISKSYRAINGVSVLDDVVYELENRIYQSIDISFRDVDYNPTMDTSTLQPTMLFKDTEYTTSEYNALLLRGYINFIASKNISNETHEYDPNNWMTWNFKGSEYVSGGEANGSWRAIYTNAYGTYRPYTHPWEMFGFTQRPEWFNQEYEPTKVVLGKDVSEFIYVYTTYVKNENGDMVSTGLWDSTEGLGDASQGIIRYGKNAGQYDKFKRFGKQPFTITPTGELNDSGEIISKIDLISPVDLGIITSNLQYREEPWAYGDMGEMEFTYMNTTLFAFDKALAMLRAKPAAFANYFFDTKNNVLQSVVNSVEKQFLYSNTRERINFNDKTIVHSENNTRILGYQTWVSDYLIYQNKNVTANYGDVLRASHINIGHKIGGFTKEDQLTFKSDSFGLVSQENQHIGLVKSIASKEEVLSAVKISWTGDGYSVSGYDLMGASFRILNPNKLGRRTSIKIGNQFVTHFNEYKTTTSDVVYGTLFKNVQELYSFICAYGEYLQSRGWIFEDQTESGVLSDWDNLAKQFVEWSQTKLNSGDFISISPSSVNAKFGSTFGSVLSVTQFSGGVWTLMDDENNGIRQFEINTSRIGNVFSVRLNNDSDKRMGLIRLNLSSFEHSVVFDDTTIFGDSIYIPKFGSVFEMLKMYGYKTANWNGRLEAKGFIILEQGTIPNFEKLVTDFKNYYDTDAIMDNNTIQDLSRHLIGYQTRNYINQMITSEPSQVDFYKGFIKEKGTNAAFEKVLRVSKTYNTNNYKALQEWAFKIGTYGNVYGKKHHQFQLLNNQIAQEPQLFIFTESRNVIHNDSYIQFFGTIGEDSRWITRPKGDINFPMRKGISNNIKLPDIGPVTLNEVDYSTRDFSTAYVDRMKYINDTGNNPSKVWVLVDGTDTWNIFNLVNTGSVLESIEPMIEDGASDVYCKLVLDRPHGLSDGDYFYFIDETEYMPDELRIEHQYFSNGSANEIVIPLQLANTIVFDENNPILMKYSAKFTQSEKEQYCVEKYSFDAPESSLFVKPSTYDKSTNITELYMNVYDPINGVIPGPIMSNIDYINTVDPAKYNSFDTTIQAWGSEKVGEVWWDTSNAFFIDYTRPILNSDGTIDYEQTLEYKRINWGKVLPSASIDVYEWVASPVLPYDWETYCKQQSTLNKGINSWTPSGTALTTDYSEFQEYNANTNSYSTVYYFWVKNTIYLPKVSTRTKSCYELSRAIINPLQFNVPWFAPVSENAFIISGIQREITDDKSILTIEYTLNEIEVIKHEQYQLCREGEEYNFNPSIWDSLWNSLRSSEQLPSGDVVELRYPENDLGIVPTKTWFMDALEARREFVKSSNDVFRTKNIITNSVVMNEIFYVKTEEVNPNLVQIKVLTYNNEFVIVPNEDKFIENDAVLVSSSGTLPEPLNSTSVYFVHFDDNGYIRLMNSPSSGGNAVVITLTSRGEGQLTMIKQSDYIESLGTSLDMTNYWKLADWYDEGYSDATAYTSEKSTAIADLKNYQEGDVIRVTDSDGLWTLYVREYSRNVPLWTAVGRQNSTIALTDNIFSGYDQYDSDGKPTKTELNVRKALGLIKGAYNGYQSKLVFDMVKYVHVEQTVVDWVFKTSYIYILGLDQTLQKSYIQNDNLINQIVEYFEEVKPYRTKIRSQIEQKTSDEDEINGVVNDLDPNGYILVDGKWIKSQTDIWDHQYAKYNESTNKWEEVGEIPLNFELPNRRFQEIDTIMVYDNVQCKPSVNYSRDDLEDTNRKYVSFDSDKLTENTQYKLQRFKFETPILDKSGIDRNIIRDLSLIYPSIDPNGNAQVEIDKLYSEFANDLSSTEELTLNVQTISTSTYATNNSWIETDKFLQFNSLANRLNLYTSMTDEQIANEVKCPFKGVILSDNTNTRLPMGFSPSNSYNFGYQATVYSFYDVVFKNVLGANPTFTDDDVRNYMSSEYGIYSTVVDFEENGRNFSDAVQVLTAMRNTLDKSLTDPYEIARQIILNKTTADIAGFVLIPRKLVKIRDVNTKQLFSVPMDMSIDEFMENEFNVNSAVLEIAEVNLNDLQIDPSNPVQSIIQEIVTDLSKAKYFDDMNAFDNLALESQYKDVEIKCSGVADYNTDPLFIDISDINPSGVDVTNIRLTVNGYGYDHSGEAQIKDQGRFQIEGLAMLNPYNMKEAIVSIPKYDEAQEYMNKDLITKNEIRYSYRIQDVLNVFGEVRLSTEHNLAVGDNVMIFTSQSKDCDVQLIDGTWKTILNVNSIKNGTRPLVFEIIAVNGKNITIKDLVFDNIYSKYDPDYMNPHNDISLNIVRVSSFGSPEFTSGSIKKYSEIRNYRVSVLDYDIFYDRLLFGSTYGETDFDVEYTSNETVVNTDGIFVDHGYNMPIYGSGVLSERVRSRMTDSLQITVLEYVPSTIQPVFDGTNWTYTGTLIDGVFINDKPARLSEVIVDGAVQNTTIYAKPLQAEDCTISNNTLTSTTSSDGMFVVVNSEIVVLMNANKMLGGQFGSCNNYYIPTETVTKFGIILGNENNLEFFVNGGEPLESSKFYNGKVINGSTIEKIIK